MNGNDHLSIIAVVQQDQRRKEYEKHKARGDFFFWTGTIIGVLSIGLLVAGLIY